MKINLFRQSASAVGPDPARWVAIHADYLYSYAMNRLNDEELCRDLVQETFLAALERLGEFRGHSSERTWLTAILKYKVIEVYRKRNSTWLTALDGHDAEPEYFEGENGHWKEAWNPQPMSIDNSDLTAQKELAAILEKCLQRLPALWQTIFSMKHMDEMKPDTIRKELKVTSSNYWVILHRAKVSLRACVEKAWL